MVSQMWRSSGRSGASATGTKLPPTSSTYGRVEHRHSQLFQSRTGLIVSRRNVFSQKNTWRVRLRQGQTSRRSSRLPNRSKSLHSRHKVIAESVQAETLRESCRLRAPPNHHLPPSDPLRAPLGQMLALGNQTLMNRAGQQCDAVLSDLITEVLAGDADTRGARWFKHVPLQVVPLF